MLNHMEYTYSAEAATDAENYSSITPPSAMRKKKNKNTRRFSDEQIRSLESMFETESKLEPGKKLKLARELGLQPRQIAIWFQNRRARWKSKQLERDCSILRSNHNNLASKFEALKKEKQALLVQLQKLNDIIQKPQEEAQSSTSTQVEASNIMNSNSENGDTIKCEAEVKARTSMEKSEHVLGVLSDDDTSIKVEYFGMDDEPDLLNFVEHAEGSLTSPEEWSTFESDHLLAQSTSDFQWWDFWS
ncbi:hypothetical protein TanjilG_11179 [Lupinus angustifolius]|uniref:Homeobox-leucine zipper protein n=1 Tax=Lupinus angustifolius TaxID=3871 RepID=A0A1J7HKL8_LUPAN|nr:PREDICTED: homeobox-leucine zipper protein ATHB-12-like isoform X1 [Lupinus angustifolius]OIW02285.1 hypothetical protein TanjilG_11179 [Lupinus angustifolius]